MTERARSKTIQEEPPEHPTDIRDGTWSRLELLQMNARFVVAMERERACDDPGAVAGAKLVCLERNFAIRSLANPAQKTQTAKSVHSWADYLATRAVTTIRLSYSTTANRHLLTAVRSAGIAPARCHDSFFVMWIPLRIRTGSSFRFV
jgi:hypothetical protein